MTIYYIKKYFIQLVLSLLISILILVFYMPSTIAITNVILFLFLIILLFINCKDYREKFKIIIYYKKSFLFLFLFFIWIVFQPIIFDNIVLSEVRGQFIIPLLFFFSGALIVLSNFRLLTYKLVFNIIFFAGLFHIFIVDIMALYTYFDIGYLPIRKKYILAVNEISYLTNLIYALLLAEVFHRLINKGKFLFLNKYTIFLIFLIFVFSIYLQGMRWGLFTFTITSLFFLSMFLINLNIARLKKVFIFILGIMIFTLLLLGSSKNDKRWDTLIETVKIVFNDKSLYWVNNTKYECPKLSSGECVNLSNYLRLAQFINGIEILIDNPQGVGYSRRAYQEIVIKKYGDDDSSFNFPHSGILNFAIGVGILGTIFYFLFIIYLLRRIYKSNKSYVQIFIFFFIIAFHTRAVLDMTFMNHNLKIFFFILGISLSSIFLENIKCQNEKTKLN